MTNYQVFSCLSTGYSHKDGCCQDFSAHYEEEGLLIAVVSDGHGDKSCFRSDMGSRFAVEIAIAQLTEFAHTLQQQGWQDWLLDEKGKQERLMRQLKRSIIGAWDTRVREHLRENPLTQEELARPSRYAERYSRGEMLTHIYGCTLIAAMAFESCLVMLHVGDGRCVVFNRQGEGCQPVPWDALCVGNVTTSMCHEDAADRCRHKVLRLEEDGVLGCFVTTDGIEDSFMDLPEQSGLNAYFSDVMARVAEKGILALVEEMKEELPYISQYGSQDDTSFGAIVDPEGIRAIEQQLSLAFATYKCRLEADAARKKLESMQRKMDILRGNVADAERRAAAADQESADAGRELEEAREEMERRRQTGPAKLEERILRLKESFQEAMQKLKDDLSAWTREAEEWWDECCHRQSRSQQNCEEAQAKLAQARTALEDYSRLRQSYVDQYDLAMAKLEALHNVQQGKPTEETQEQIPAEEMIQQEIPAEEVRQDMPEEETIRPETQTEEASEEAEMPEEENGASQEEASQEVPGEMDPACGEPDIGCIREDAVTPEDMAGWGDFI